MFAHPVRARANRYDLPGQRKPDQNAKVDARPYRTGWRCGFLRLVASRTGLRSGDDFELAAVHGEHHKAFGNYEVLLRNYIGAKQKGAERFASAFAPKTRAGLFFRNQIIRAFAFPGLAKLAIDGHDGRVRIGA
jgi:hypothetical protein